MLQWFKIHSEFLKKESTALACNSNYKERIQYRDNLFISHGDIIVRFNGTHRFPILVVYHNATPYRLPSIFPLIQEISNQEVVELASLDVSELVKKIKSKIRYYPSLRHQNSSGELCTLERADLDGPSTFYGITTILQRVRDWCAGHLTGNYPPDSEEVNFQAHFNFINDDTKLFYADQFLDPTLLEGDCYAKILHINGDHRRIYWGCFVDGIGKSGLIQQPIVDLSRYRLHEKIRNSNDIYLESSIVETLIEKKELLKAHWFHVNNEPLPFEKLVDLISIMGGGNYQVGVSRLQHCIDSFKMLLDFFYLAIRFPNRKGNYEFQLFKIYKKEDATFVGISEKNPLQKMQFILDCYEKVEVVESEKLTPESFYQRNSKRANYLLLKDKFVNIMGVGALGSEIADCIAKAGIGSTTLFDNQAINAHNAVRHLAGLEFIGFPKVMAVKKVMYNHNPYITVEPKILDLFDLDIANHLNNHSLSICSVADDNVEGFINQQLVIANRPAFYARALRGGKTARIFRVVPGQDACFHCLSLYRNEGQNFIEIPEDSDYPTLMNECNNPIRPASAADLKFIAAMVSRMVIDHLQNEQSTNNHWIWSTDAIDGTVIQTPNQLHAQHILPHQHCPYCHQDGKAIVTIDPKCVSFMQELISTDPTIETGGIMAGWVDDIGNVTVTHVSGPGPKALKTSTRFEKDVEFCQKFLDDLYLESNQKATYVGEWHSHPSSDNHPSGTDIKSLSEIAVERNYLTACPAMIIFSNTGQPSCTLHPAGKRYYFADLYFMKNQ